MRLTVVHGDIDNPEEQESLEAIHNAVFEDSGGRMRTIGTNDTTTYVTDRPLSANTVAQLEMCVALYPWWKITRTEAP